MPAVYFTIADLAIFFLSDQLDPKVSPNHVLRVFRDTEAAQEMKGCEGSG